MIKKIVYPPWISKKMEVRFDILEFCVDVDGFLYSPKSYNDNFDLNTKVLWLRSIGMTPNNIAKRFNLKVSTITNKGFLGLLTLDYSGKNYTIRKTTRHDWSNRGYVDNYLKRHIRYGGVPDVPNPQQEMDSELNQILHDYEQPDEPTQITNKLYDPYKEYYGDYKD